MVNCLLTTEGQTRAWPMSRVDQDPDLRSRFLIEFRAAAPAPGQVFQAEAEPEFAGEPHQSPQFLQGALPAEVQGGVPTQADVNSHIAALEF